MLDYGGWYLAQHAQEPEVRFNLLHGGYDFVVLQEHAHPFGTEEKFLEAPSALNGIIRAVGAIQVVYQCWAKKSEPKLQEDMNNAHQRVAKEIGALLALVGEKWWGIKKAGQSWNYMRKTAPMLLELVQTSQQSTSGKPYVEFFENRVSAC